MRNIVLASWAPDTDQFFATMGELKVPEGEIFGKRIDWGAAGRREQEKSVQEVVMTCFVPFHGHNQKIFRTLAPRREVNLAGHSHNLTYQTERA